MFSLLWAKMSKWFTDHFKPQADFTHALGVGNEKFDAILLGGQVDVWMCLAPWSDKSYTSVHKPMETCLEVHTGSSPRQCSWHPAVSQTLKRPKFYKCLQAQEDLHGSIHRKLFEMLKPRRGQSSTNVYKRKKTCMEIYTGRSSRQCSWCLAGFHTLKRSKLYKRL